MNSVAERGPRRVESRQNSRIKELRAALVRGARTSHIAVEGLHLIEEAIKSSLKLHTVFVRKGNEGLLEHLELGEAEVLIVTEDVFLSATATEHPQGIAALVHAPQVTLQAMLNGTPLVVIAAALCGLDKCPHLSYSVASAGDGADFLAEHAFQQIGGDG